MKELAHLKQLLIDSNVIVDLTDSELLEFIRLHDDLTGATVEEQYIGQVVNNFLFWYEGMCVVLNREE